MFAPILPRPTIPSCILRPPRGGPGCTLAGLPAPEYQNIETLDLTHDPCLPRAPLSSRYLRIRLFVELSCASGGSVRLSSSGTIRCASALPSSTPHWSNELISQ